MENQRMMQLIYAAVLLTSGFVSADFAYGVNSPDTGDMKAHRQITTADGGVEGEYRWLQPNGLYRVTRYFVDGDSGYQAFVSEEAGEPVDNFYTNTFHNIPGTFISSQINDDVQLDNTNRGFSGSAGNIIQSLGNNLNADNSFQRRPSVSEFDNRIVPDVVVVGENTQLTSKLPPLLRRFKRNSPPILNLDQFRLNRFQSPTFSGSFSSSSANSHESSSNSNSGSRSTSSGPGHSSSESFSSSGSSSSGSSSKTQSFSSSGSRFPQYFFRTKRSPKPQSFSQSSSGAFGGNTFATSSSKSGGSGSGTGLGSFSSSSAGGFGNDFGTQSSSQAFSGGQGFGIGPGSFSKSSAGGFGNNFGTQSSSQALSGGQRFGIGPGSFSTSSAGAFGNGFGPQSFSEAFSRASGFG